MPNSYNKELFASYPKSSVSFDENIITGKLLNIVSLEPLPHIGL